MKKSVIFGFSFILLFCSLVGCAGPSHVVAWHLNKGQSYSVKVNQNSDLRMIFPGADRKENEMVLACKVIEKNNETLVIEATIESVQARMKTLGGISCYYNSKTGESKITPEKNANDARSQKFINTFKELVGKKYRVIIDPNDAKASLGDIDKTIKESAYKIPGEDMFGDAQVRMLLAQANLIEYVTGGLSGYSEPVDIAVGATWSRESEITAPEVQIIPVIKKYAIKSVGDEKNENKVTISFDIVQPESEPGKKKKRPTTRFIATQINCDPNNCVMTYDAGKGVVTGVSEKVFIEIERNEGKTAAKENRRKARIFYIVDKKIEFDMK